MNAPGNGSLNPNKCFYRLIFREKGCFVVPVFFSLSEFVSKVIYIWGLRQQLLCDIGVLSFQGADLFKRAILMSGSSLSSWDWVEQHSHYAVKAAIQLGCEVPEDVNKHYEAILHCLRNRTVEQILKVGLFFFPNTQRLYNNKSYS